MHFNSCSMISLVLSLSSCCYAVTALSLTSTRLRLVTATASTRIAAVSTTTPFIADNRTLYVGNLDWTLSHNECTEILTSVVGNDTAVIIEIKKKTNKTRDATKCHGGSATLTFDTHQQTTQALKLLQDFSKEQSSQRNYKVRFAFLRPQPKPIKELITEERKEWRKARAKSYNRQRQRVANRTDQIIQSLRPDLPTIVVPVLDAPKLDWSSCPDTIDPMGKGGGLTSDRGNRKRAAVEAFLCVLQNALLDLKTNNPGHGQLIADLGCGAGNLALPLAWWLRSSGCRVRGVDLHSNSLKRLAQRARDATVDVEHLEMDLLLLMDTNDSNTTSMFTDCSAVVSLHACGAASDMSIAAAVVNSLPFAVSPCCIGKVKNVRRHPGNMPSFYHSATTGGSPRVEISFPRSIWLREAVTPNEYQLLAAAADYGGSESVFDTNEFNRRQRCREAKRIVELDRLRWAQERGYYVRMVELPRIGPHYLKRELLLGAKEGSEAASRIRCLPVLDTLECLGRGKECKIEYM